MSKSKAFADQSVDHKIIAYEVHYVREAIKYLREGKLDECGHWLKRLDTRVDTLAHTLGRVIKEYNI